MLRKNGSFPVRGKARNLFVKGTNSPFQGVGKIFRKDFPYISVFVPAFYTGSKATGTTGFIPAEILKSLDWYTSASFFPRSSLQFSLELYA